VRRGCGRASFGRAALVGAIAVAFALPAAAQTAFFVSPDTAVDLTTLPTVVQDDEMAIPSAAGALIDLGPLPDSADVVAQTTTDVGERLFSLDAGALLAGGVFASAGDVVGWDGSVYWIELSAASNGIPDGASIDALSADLADLIVSFDTTVDLGVLTAADEDLVRWDGANWSLALDTSAHGVDDALDLDGASSFGEDKFVVSFDTHGFVGGVDFADEDLLYFDGVAWSLDVDTSTLDPGWRDVDVVAVPEPGFATSLALGLALLSFAGPHRASKPSLASAGRKCRRSPIA